MLNLALLVFELKLLRVIKLCSCSNGLNCRILLLLRKLIIFSSLFVWLVDTLNAPPVIESLLIRKLFKLLRFWKFYLFI